jgi:hypothetical protein
LTFVNINKKPFIDFLLLFLPVSFTIEIAREQDERENTGCPQGTQTQSGKICGTVGNEKNYPFHD